MQCFQPLNSNAVGIDGRVKNTLVLLQHVLPIFPEEANVERIPEIFLDERLKPKYIPAAVEIVEGDLCDVNSLDPFFKVPE